MRRSLLYAQLLVRFDDLSNVGLFDLNMNANIRIQIVRFRYVCLCVVCFY